MGRIILLVAFLILTLQASATEVKDDVKKCRALVLEGGGDMGSYQIGVLKTFVKLLKPEDIMYDVVTGVSVGSINAVALSVHEIGKEKEAVEWMYDLWGTLTASNIYTSWRFGIVEGLFFEEGIWDNSPAIAYLTQIMDEFKENGLRRKINIGTVDFDTGDVTKYTEALPFSDIPKAIVASTSMPFAFPHTHFQNHTFVDGGAVWNIDLSGAIERCMEVVSNPRNIIIDVILCNTAQNVTRDEHKNWNTISNFSRYQQIRSYYSALSDYYELARQYEDIVEFRYLLVPETDLPSGFLPLNFVQADIQAMIKIGEDEATKAIEEGPRFTEKLRGLLKNGKHFAQ